MTVVAMATDGCLKEYHEWCEIHVCLDAPTPAEFGVHRRLRFGLLASSWLPSRVGRFFWIALHLLLVVVGPVVAILAWLLYAFIFLGVAFSCYLGLTCYLVMCTVFTLAIESVHLLVRSIRFCWSVVCNHVSFLASQESTIVVWRGNASDAVYIWADFKVCSVEYFWFSVWCVVPCVRNSFCKELMDGMMEAWVQWCNEVLHTPGAIAM